MVAVLVATELRRRAVIPLRAGFHQSDALCVIRDVQGLALQGDSIPVAAVLTVDLEAAQVDALFHPGRRLPGGRLTFSHLAHALARGVVYVVGPLACSLGNGLLLGH